MGGLGLIAVALAGPAAVPWAAPRSGDTVRLAVLGSLPQDPTQLLAAVNATSPDLLVFTGVRRRDDLSGWAGGSDLLAVPDGGSARAWARRFTGRAATPWTTVDLDAGGVVWRVLVLTTDPSPLTRWETQLGWLPVALEPQGWDRLIVLADAPRHTLTPDGPAPAAKLLLDRVQDLTQPRSFALWIAGNQGANELLAPGGPLEELHLGAGASGGRRGTLGRAGAAMPGLGAPPGPHPAWAEALTAWGTQGPSANSPEGFWTLQLAGDTLTLDFHRHGPQGWSPALRLVRDGQGWRAVDGPAG